MNAATPVVWLAVAGWMAAACVPPTSAYLTVPIEPAGDEGLELAVVEVSLAELALRMDDLDPRQLAFYNVGREPVPHELRDTDGDGRPDIAVVVIPVPAEGTFLSAVCPGPRTSEPVPSGGVEGAVTLRFDRSYR